MQQTLAPAARGSLTSQSHDTNTQRDESKIASKRRLASEEDCQLSSLFQPFIDDHFQDDLPTLPFRVLQADLHSAG